MGGAQTLTGDDHLTSPGSTLGTIAYMSPEQVQASRSTHAPICFPSASFSTRWPRAGCRFRERREAWFSTPASRRSGLNRGVNPQAPAKIESVIEKALEKDRDVRYQHASEMRADLARARRDTSSASSSAKTPIRVETQLAASRTFWVIGALLVLALAGFLLSPAIPPALAPASASSRRRSPSPSCPFKIWAETKKTISSEWPCLTRSPPR